MKYQAIFLAIGVLLLLFGFAHSEQQGKGKSQAERIFARATEDDYMGSEACASCHEDVSKGFAVSPHAPLMAHAGLPLDKQGCEGCHGPGRIHQAEENAEVIAFRKMTPEESSAACMRCHGQTLSEVHWKVNEHKKAGLSCVSCHQIHPTSDPALTGVKKGNAKDARSPIFVAKGDPKPMLKADEATLCGSCHGPTLGDFKHASHHPVPEGSMVCRDCHTPHPTKDAKVRKDALKNNCVTCHTEMAGPFVFEHDPVSGHTGDGCLECHQPHGSNNPKMLNSVSRGLCSQCHTDKLGRHYPGQTCWTAGCHVASHGSNTDPRFLKH